VIYLTKKFISIARDIKFVPKCNLDFTHFWIFVFLCWGKMNSDTPITILLLVAESLGENCFMGYVMTISSFWLMGCKLAFCHVNIFIMILNFLPAIIYSCLFKYIMSSLRSSSFLYSILSLIMETLLGLYAILMEFASFMIFFSF
jgi:hypothetical protein